MGNQTWGIKLAKEGVLASYRGNKGKGVREKVIFGSEES